MDFSTVNRDPYASILCCTVSVQYHDPQAVNSSISNCAQVLKTRFSNRPLQADIKTGYSLSNAVVGILNSQLSGRDR